MSLVMCFGHWDHKHQHHSFRNKEPRQSTQTSLHYGTQAHESFRALCSLTPAFKTSWKKVIHHEQFSKTFHQEPTYPVQRWHTCCSELLRTPRTALNGEPANALHSLRSNCICERWQNTTTRINLLFRRCKKFYIPGRTGREGKAL